MTIATGRYRTKYIPGVPSNSISFCIFVFLTGSCWVWGKLCWGRGESRVRPEQRHPHSGNERLAHAERKGVLCLVVPVCVLMSSLSRRCLTFIILQVFCPPGLEQLSVVNITGILRWRGRPSACFVIPVNQSAFVTLATWLGHDQWEVRTNREVGQPLTQVGKLLCRCNNRN